jgi:hypothetical protein
VANKGAAMRRGVGMVILMFVVAAIIGSGLAYVMANIFPTGPVHTLLFQVFSIGVPTFAVNLGFLTITFGISLAITGLTVLLMVLVLVLLFRF